LFFSCNSGITNSEIEQDLEETETDEIPVGNENETEEIDLTNRIYIIFNGQNSSNQAEFSLGNTTSDSVSYSGYSQNLLFYDTEMISDDEWVILFNNWCATGVDTFYLDPDSAYNFIVQNPSFSCTWRVKKLITNMTQDTSYFLYSDGIEYIHDGDE